MNIYLVARRGEIDYDEFDSLVVSAPDPETARVIHPYGIGKGESLLVSSKQEFTDNWGSWVQPDQVTVSLIGVSYSKELEIHLTSFNAG